MVQLLKTLTCFNHIHAIEPIKHGLSSQCYYVHADSKYFFAKKITTINEPIVSIHAASKNISPIVFYHDRQWLITEFIKGDNLSLYQNSLDKKILIATKLIAQCHQIKVKIATLTPKNIIQSLMLNQVFSTQQVTELQHYSQSLITSLDLAQKISKNNVCCHGDVNFSNILISHTNKPYLIDYECAYSAPAEYDLAMFIAVNNINENKISMIVQHYNSHISHEINVKVLMYYLQFCYFINGLWYQQANQKNPHTMFPRAIKQQWQQLSLDQTLFNLEAKK